MRVVLICAILLLPGLALAAQPRFYFSGDGVISLRSGHSDETLEVRYRRADGSYDAEALARIERFFRSRSDGKQGPVSLRLIELIDFAQDRYHPKTLTLVSGYRSPEFNQELRNDGRRVAQASLHTEGMAADLGFGGLDLRRLWLQLRQLQTGGVGLYRGDGFLHLDTGRPRFWEPATSGVEKNLSADNARLFARTDFDRYDDLDGAVIRLHSVTALPILIHREARLGDQTLGVKPRGEAKLEGDCWLLDTPAESYELVVASPARAPAKRAAIHLRTCEPRLGATPEEIETNPVERLGGKK